jgi:hypothetical protein
MQTLAQRVAQAVSENVEAEDDDEDREPGEQRQVVRNAVIGSAVRQHRAHSGLGADREAPDCKQVRLAHRIAVTGIPYGGYETLAAKVNLVDRALKRADAQGTLIRLHIGLKDVEDLIADLERALIAPSGGGS